MTDIPHNKPSESVDPTHIYQKTLYNSFKPLTASMENTCVKLNKHDAPE